MSEPATPEEWSLALMQGYAIMLQEPVQYHAKVQETIASLLVLSDKVLRTWKARDKETCDTDLQLLLMQELMRAEGLLNALTLLGKITIEEAPRLPLSLAYKWHQGWNGYIASLHAHL